MSKLLSRHIRKARANTEKILEDTLRNGIGYKTNNKSSQLLHPANMLPSAIKSLTVKFIRRQRGWNWFSSSGLRSFLEIFFLIIHRTVIWWHFTLKASITYASISAIQAPANSIKIPSWFHIFRLKAINYVPSTFFNWRFFRVKIFGKFPASGLPSPRSYDAKTARASQPPERYSNFILFFNLC